MYGVQVTGFDNRELLRVQRMSAAQLPPFTGGESRKKTLLLHGDPAAVAATSAADRLAKEI